MRKGLFIFAVLLPVVLIAGGVYLVGLRPGSEPHVSDTSKSEQAGPPSAAKNSQRKSGVPDIKDATAKMAPVLDVARIDPKGASVFAGRAEPYAIVTVLANDKAVGKVKADEFGEWALLVEKPLAADEKQITLKAERQETVSLTQPQAPKASVPETLAKRDDATTAWVSRKAPTQAPASDVKPGEANAAVSEDRSAKAVTSRLMEDIKELVVTAQKQVASQAPRAKSTAPRAKSTASSTESTAPRTESAASSTESAAARTEDQIETALPGRNGAVKLSRSAKVFQSAGEAKRRGGVSLLSGEKDAPNLVPFPIKFVFREAKFTPQGGEAAKLLLTYVKLKKFKTITLSGHADERGGEHYNIDLSRQRLETVSRYLAEGGFRGQVVLAPKGESEPFQGVDRRKYPLEELYQLDRRVELDLRE